MSKKYESVDVYDLRVGDIFVEEHYPERYRVVKVSKNVVLAEDIETGEKLGFGYTIPAYAPDIMRINE